MSRPNNLFGGEWRIVELHEFEDAYLEEAPRKPFIRLEGLTAESVNGEYLCGFSSGQIDGVIRTFNGERVMIFGFEGSDEMDAAGGGGWMQLQADGSLEGEFIGSLGHFTARRVSVRKKQTPTKPPKPGTKRKQKSRSGE